MMVCQACGSENPGGAVFCNNCGERMVVSDSDLNFGAYSPEEAPFYEAQGFGLRMRFSRDGFMLRMVPVYLTMFAFSAILIGGGLSGSLLPEAVHIGLVMVILLCVGILVQLAFISHYRKVGRPLDFGGSGSGPPSAAQVMEVEDDIRKRDATPDESGSVPSRSDRTLPRR